MDFDDLYDKTRRDLKSAQKDIMLKQNECEVLTKVLWDMDKYKDGIEKQKNK